jgi:hypothetical protein
VVGAETGSVVAQRKPDDLQSISFRTDRYRAQRYFVYCTLYIHITMHIQSTFIFHEEVDSDPDGFASLAQPMSAKISFLLTLALFGISHRTGFLPDVRFFPGSWESCGVTTPKRLPA